MVPYSSDVLCVHKTRLQRLYMDVQPLKMVQMVSQPIYSAILIDSIRCVYPFAGKMCEILDKISHRRNVNASDCFLKQSATVVLNGKTDWPAYNL